MNFEHAVFDAHLLTARFHERGLNFKIVAQKALVDIKTAKKMITTGEGSCRCAYRIAKVLGFDVKETDLSLITVKRNGKRRTA